MNIFKEFFYFCFVNERGAFWYWSHDMPAMAWVSALGQITVYRFYKSINAECSPSKVTSCRILQSTTYWMEIEEMSSHAICWVESFILWPTVSLVQATIVPWWPFVRLTRWSYLMEKERDLNENEKRKGLFVSHVLVL